MRTLSTLAAGLALAYVCGQAAGQVVRPAPPTLVIDGYGPPVAAPVPSGGLSSARILFREDFEGQRSGTISSGIPNWSESVVGAAPYAVVRIADSGGPALGQHLDVTLESNGTTNWRAEVRLNDPNYDTLTMPYVGSGAAPTYPNIPSAADYELADEIWVGYTIHFSQLLDEHVIARQYLDRSALDECPTGGARNPAFRMDVSRHSIEGGVKCMEDAGGNGHVFATAAGFGWTSFEGHSVDVIEKHVYSSRNASERSNGQHVIYLYPRGNPSSAPVWSWQGKQTVHPGPARFTLQGDGPLVPFFKWGVYRSGCKNGHCVDGQRIRIAYDNIVVARNATLAEMQAEVAKPNFR